MNNLVIFCLFLFFVFMVALREFKCTTKFKSDENSYKHSLLISCGYEYLYDKHLCMFYWQKDDIYYFEDDLKYLKLRELEEMVK